jgi:hypothetical protein
MQHTYSLSRCLLLCGAALWPIFPSLGQSSPADSVVLASTVSHLNAQYREALGSQKLLLNGMQYVEFGTRSVVGHPFLDTTAVFLGGVHYDGYYFPNLDLQYDINQDALILADSTTIRMRLISEKVQYFKLGNRAFLRLQDHANEPIATGFYELLIDEQKGPVQLLAKRTKVIERKGGAEFKQEYHQYNKYFLHTDKGYKPVSKASTVLALAPDKKKDLREFIHAKKLKFGKKKREASLTALVAYYDSLAKAETARK